MGKRSSGDKRKRDDESDDDCLDLVKRLISPPGSPPKKLRRDSEVHKDRSTPSSSTEDRVTLNRKLDFSSPIPSIKLLADDSDPSPQPQSTDSKSGIEFVDGDDSRRSLQSSEDADEEKPTEDVQLQKLESLTPEMAARTIVAYLKFVVKPTSETETAGRKTQRAATLLLLAEKISEEAQKLLAGTHHIVQFEV